MSAVEPFVSKSSALATIRATDAIDTKDRWIDVDIAKQTLTAYEGKRPVRAFRVSTGVGNDGAMYSTPKGVYRIYAKLRTATMASDAGDPHPYRFEAVPHVQYFNREVALHGAYWHDRFGERVSHGCVNLAPDDAAWLFDFTTPKLLPSEKESAAAGTVVRVR
jgi:lipoprotein-anchoring transpeptidase ErfK/SrfK